MPASLAPAMLRLAKNTMELMLWNAAAIGGLMLLLWLVSLPLRDVSIVDIFWGPGYVLVAWLSYSYSIATQKTCYLLPLLVTLWGLRLGGYLLYRNWGKGEDKRYAKMRERNPGFSFLSLFYVFGLQGLLMWIISLPLQLGIPDNRGVVNAFTFIGTGLWLLGIFFEAVGDWQMARFQAKEENQGEVLNTGLWRYTRHPNYFGDFLVWWGFYVLAISPGGQYWTVIGPIIMSILLMKVSGVTLLEKDLKESKPGYAEYVERTNAFFPWFPKPAESVNH